MITFNWTNLVRLLIITASIFSILYIKTNHEPIHNADSLESLILQQQLAYVNKEGEVSGKVNGDGVISDHDWTKDNDTSGIPDDPDPANDEITNDGNPPDSSDENKGNISQQSKDNDKNKANGDSEPDNIKNKNNGLNNDTDKTSGNDGNTKAPNDHIPDRGGHSAEKPTNPNASYNSIVIDIINTYQGSYPYLLNEDYANYNGVTENIYYQDQLFLKAHPSGKKYSHCSGITFEVFFKAMEQWNKNHGITGNNIKNLSYWELQDFMLTWYVAMGPKDESNLAIALEKYGLGKKIDRLEDAKPGDFLDFSRENNTGHTVVFLGWVKEEGRIIGLKYWSSQDSTRGIAYKTEYFNVLRGNGTKYGNVMIDNIYIGRVTP